MLNAPAKMYRMINKLNNRSYSAAAVTQSAMGGRTLSARYVDDEHVKPPQMRNEKGIKWGSPAKPKGGAERFWSTMHRTTRCRGDRPTAAGTLTSNAGATHSAARHVPPGPARGAAVISANRFGAFARAGLHGRSRRSGVHGTEPHDIGPALPPMAPTHRSGSNVHRGQLRFASIPTRASIPMVASSVLLSPLPRSYSRSVQMVSERSGLVVRISVEPGSEEPDSTSYTQSY